jgi:hypothetical protein
MFDTRKSFNRIPTYSMPNVNLIRHRNHHDEHFLRTELSFNVFDYSYTPKRTLMVKKEKKADNIIVFMTADIIIVMAKLRCHKRQDTEKKTNPSFSYINR